MMFLRFFAILVALSCVAFGAPIEENAEITPLADPENYRLPLNIKPSNYKIILRPYLLSTDGDKRFKFDGEVEIQIVPDTNTREIVLHTKRLTFSKSEYWSTATPTAKTNLPTGVYNEVTDKMTYTLTTDLIAKQTYVLHFIYTGLMEDDMHGFYRSSYIDANNATRWLASTQFQTNHARRAFPSFDEPKFKATFDVSIQRHKSMKSIGNTRILSSTLTGDYITDVYDRTPKMSTYILAFIVSEFNERQDGDFGVIARPEYFDQTKYSFEVGPKILNELDNYLNFKYYDMGVDKMHMAAIPDFSAGAMENWGLLTYRERSLLYDEKFSTLSSKQSIAGVIAHEQAHMWFGDLVTCDWWSYTWLNEGFARYFQYFATANVEKEFHMDEQFTVDQIQSVMGMDSTNSTNPMSDPNTNSPADLSRMFNSISYNKGGTVIRMVKYILGEEKFRKSLQDYLQKYQYQNTVPQNLFDFWKAAWPTQHSTYTDSFFKTFTEQVGYPLVTINVGDNRNSYTVSQKRFMLKDADISDGSLLYTIPFSMTDDKSKNFNVEISSFLEATTEKKTVSIGHEVNWVIANIQQNGYYRVNYDNKTWHGIHHALFDPNWGGIHELNRAQVVDDLLNLARAGEIDYELAMEVLEYLETETEYAPWTAAFNGFSYLTIRLGTDTDNFGHYIRLLTEKAYKSLGFEERETDTALHIYTRTKILSWSCKFRNSECISKAKEYFNQPLSSTQQSQIPVNIRSVVYCTAMREGNEADYDKLFKQYKSATTATEETLILNNLGCVKDKNLVSKHFSVILSDEVRRQDKSSALSTLYTENNENVTPVFELVTAQFEELNKAMGGYSAVATVISNIASRFTEKEQEQKLKTFNQQNKSKFGSSAATLENAEKLVAENLAWAESKLGKVKTYLGNYKSGSATTSAFTMLTIVLVSVVAMLFK